MHSPIISIRELKTMSSGQSSLPHPDSSRWVRRLIVIGGIVVLVGLLTNIGITALSDPHITIERVTTEDEGALSDLGLEVVRYRFDTPKDIKVIAWLEYYDHGNLDKDASFGFAAAPSPGNEEDGVIRFSRHHPPELRDGEGDESRWTLAVSGTRTHRIVADPFLRRTRSSGNRLGDQPSEFGRTYTLWYMAADAGDFIRTQPADAIKENDHAVLLKVRFERADPDREGGYTAAVSPPFDFE